MATATATPAPEAHSRDTTVHSRAYQLEMLEESLKRNIIVAACLSVYPTIFKSADNMLLDGYWKRQNTYVILNILLGL